MLSSNQSLTQPGLREGQKPVTRPDAPAKSDTLLQASRRVDWRFLLPNPNLGQVAYLGPAGGALLEALKLFSAGLTVIESPQTQNTVRYDVVVASNLSNEALRQATKLVKPSGFLYAEIYQRWQPSSGPRNPASYVAAMQALGFAEVEAYWHWPNFESCAEIVSLADPAAVLHALSRRNNLAARVKAMLGRGLLYSGGLAFIISCFSVVGQRRAA